jgi:hypothetical protein
MLQPMEKFDVIPSEARNLSSINPVRFFAALTPFNGRLGVFTLGKMSARRPNGHCPASSPQLFPPHHCVSLIACGK